MPYLKHGIRIDPDGALDLVLGGISQQSINTGATVIRESANGTIYDEAVNLASTNPGATFTTFHVREVIANLLASNGVSLCVTSQSGGTGVTAYAAEYNCGGLVGNGTDIAFTMAQGALVVRRLTVDHQGNASFQLAMMPVAIPPNSAITRAVGVTAPQPTFNEARYTMYTMQVGGLAIDQKRNIEIDFAVNAQLEATDSEIEPTTVSVRRSSPRMTVRSLTNQNLLNPVNVPPTGLKCTHANSFMWLTRRRSLPTDNHHILLTFNGIAYLTQLHDASGEASGTSALMIDLAKDASNNPIVWAVDQAIS